jgi:hypothetical protein
MTRPFIWDRNDFKRNLVNSNNTAWKESADAFECGSLEIRGEKKTNSLVVSCRRERRKSRSLKSESGANEMYRSPWFTFKTLPFLADKLKPIYAQNRNIEVSAQRVLNIHFK